MSLRLYNHKFEEISKEKEEKIKNYEYKLQNDKNKILEYYFITDNIYAPILDQGSLGSCVANACYTLFYILSKGKILLSRIHLYYICRALDGSSSNEDTGTYLRTALKSLFKYNLTNENNWKYDPKKFSQLSPPICFCNTYSLKNYNYRKVNQNINSLIDCLFSGYPIMIGIKVYSSFESNDSNNTGLIPNPDINKEQFLGGHALLIIGYDNYSRYFKVQNSWGSNWGSNGYCFISYDYILNPNLTIEIYTVTFTL